MWNEINLNVDIKKKNNRFIEVNQADDIALYINLYCNGQPLVLVKDEDTIIVNYVNANGTVTGDSNILKSIQQNGVNLYLPRNCTNSYGTAHMQVTINKNNQYTNNKQTTSFPIDIKIHQSVVDGKAVSTNINSMIDNINKATIEGNKVINNIKDTAVKYPPSSQLYADVEDLKVREYGAENLLKDAGFNGSIGEGFCWKNANSDTNLTITYEPALKAGNYMTLSSNTAQPGVIQTVDTGGKLKSSYTVSLRVHGTAGNVVYIALHGVETKSYTFKNTNVWENVVVTFNTNVSNWSDKQLIIFGTAKSTFLITEVAMWEGKNSFSFKFNSKDPIYDRIKISGKDVLGINKSGKYAGINCINNPFNDSVTWAYYDVEVHSSTYKKVIARSYHSSLEYVNTMNNGTWSGWEQLTTQTLAKNPSNITQDSTHRFVTDTEKNKWNMITGNGPKQQNSYLKLPSGIIIQWGVTSVSIPSKSSNTATATFPTPFPNKLLTIQANVNRNISTKDKTGCENIISNGIMASGVDIDKTKVDIFAKDVIGSGSNWTFEIGWFAIGY